MGFYLGLMSGTSMDAIDAALVDLDVSPGGAHSAGLVQAIAQLMAPDRVATTATLGLDPDYVEAVAFGWFARRTLEGLTSSAASVTGAAGPRILGGVYRYA
jgi:anhydro-N-acetylmuramic acid kinase